MALLWQCGRQAFLASIAAAAAAAESRLRRLDLRQAEREGDVPAVPAMGGVGGADRQAGGPAGAGRVGAVYARALSCTQHWHTRA